jgi:hypothetical protein
MFTLLVAVACSTGPTAPAVTDTDIACIEELCLLYPVGWEVETGDAYIAFSHPAAPGRALATAAPVNMEALVENAGGSWPAPTEDVVAAFWQLLEEADVATFGHMERLTGGSFRSEGSYEDGRLWHLLIPGEGSRAVAVEVRGPNASWEDHADLFFSAVVVNG